MKWRLTPANVPRVGTFLILVAVLLPFAFVLLRAVLWEAPRETQKEEEPIARFLMGSPLEEEGRYDWETQHEVTLTKPFALAATEVSQAQFLFVMGVNPVAGLEDSSDRSCAGAGVGDDLPVVCVSWENALEYCNRLSDLEGLERAYEEQSETWRWIPESVGYRLPTEAEWEYAARAGSQWQWVRTGKKEEVCQYGNVRDASFERENPQSESEAFSCDDGFAGLSPVRAHKPNSWGFYGMGGNAAEWVWDGYEEFSAEAKADPTGKKGASLRVIRGGSWGNGPRFARVADRSRWHPSFRFVSLGFRVARSLPNSLALEPSDPRSPNSGGQPGVLRDGLASEAARAGEAPPGADSRGLEVE